MQDVAAQGGEHSKIPFHLIPVARLLLRHAEAQDVEVAGRLQRHTFGRFVRPHRFGIDQVLGETERQRLLPPVGKVEKRVEIAGKHLFGIVLEVAPLIVHPGVRRAHLDVAGEFADRGPFGRGQWPVDGLPFVMLVFAYR